MAQYNYELFGNFKASDRTSNISLGTIVLNDNDISGSSTDAFLMGVANSNFGGTIAKEEKRINGKLTKVTATRKGSVNQKQDKAISNSSGRSFGSKMVKGIVGLLLGFFVWYGYVMLFVFKGAYWEAPKKAFAWYKNYVS